MTTIVYRNGVMASDSGSWAGGASISWAKKLARGADGTLYGVTGNAPEATAFLDWVESGCIGPPPKAEALPDSHSSFVVLCVPPSGLVTLIAARGVERYDAPYFAVGSGAPVAFGALFMGATAEEAIEAAKEHGEGAHGPVQSIRREMAA